MCRDGGRNIVGKAAADIGRECEKCVEIDKAIERFRQVGWSICDQLTVERAKEVIADLEAKKATLHQEQKQKERITA